MTLTPEQATFYAAAIVTIGAILGIFIRGAIDSRLSKKQLDLQRAMLTEQLATQERIAAAGRADGRALALLSERRQLYGELITQTHTLGVKVRKLSVEEGRLSRFDFATARREWEEAHEEYLPIEAFSEAAEAYELRAQAVRDVIDVERELAPILGTLELVSSQEIRDLSAQLLAYPQPHVAPDAEAMTEHALQVKEALHKLVDACRADLSGVHATT